MAIRCRFALAVPEDAGNTLAIDELRAALAEASLLALEPIFVPTYAALYETMGAGRADLAWAPPLVARDLSLAGLAGPLVAPVRFDESAYHAALVVLPSSPLVHVEDLRGARVGWVSKLSAAGYVVPRGHLRALGIDPATFFASEALLGSHAAVADALVRGAIDVGATYAAVRREALLAAPETPTRIVVSAGPIPSDVVVIASGTDGARADALSEAFIRVRPRPRGALRRLMKVDRFVAVGADHLAPLAPWTG